MKTSSVVVCVAVVSVWFLGCDTSEAAEPEAIEPAQAQEMAQMRPKVEHAPEVAAAQAQPVFEEAEVESETEEEAPAEPAPCEVETTSNLPGVRIEILGPCTLSLGEDGELPADLTAEEKERLEAGSVEHVVRYRIVVDEDAPSKLIPAVAHADTRASFGIALAPGMKKPKRKKKQQKKRYYACDEEGPSGLVVKAKLNGVLVDAPVTAPPPKNIAVCNPLGPELYTCKDRKPNATHEGTFEHRFVFNGRTMKSHDLGLSWSTRYKRGEYPLYVWAEGMHKVKGKMVPFRVSASAKVHLVD